MMTLRETIEEALAEARILECASDVYREDHVLFVAQKLSGAPFSFVKQVFEEQKPKYVEAF